MPAFKFYLAWDKSDNLDEIDDLEGATPEEALQGRRRLQPGERAVLVDADEERAYVFKATKSGKVRRILG